MEPLTPSPIIPQSPTVPAATSRDRVAANSDFQTFLTLLTAQLRNQDPLAPLDSTQFVAQLASFSTVEQLIGANERLDALSVALGGNELMRLADWIGREIATADGVFTATGGEVRFAVGTVASAERIEAVVSTPEGIVLRRFEIDTAAGEAAWDGLNDSGTAIAGQALRIDLFHLRGEEVLLEERAAVFSRVVGISDGDDGVRVQLENGRRIAPSDVSDIRA